LYEKGSGYGSETLNLHKKPLVNLKNGKDAQLNPIISNGRVIEVQVLSGGSEYYSLPEISVIGNGSGAIIKPVINNGQIVDVVVLNGGIGYDKENSYIKVKPRGSGALFDIRVRSLTVNDAERYANYADRHIHQLLDGHMMEIQFMVLLDIQIQITFNLV